MVQALVAISNVRQLLEPCQLKFIVEETMQRRKSYQKECHSIPLILLRFLLSRQSFQVGDNVKLRTLPLGSCKRLTLCKPVLAIADHKLQPYARDRIRIACLNVISSPLKPRAKDKYV